MAEGARLESVCVGNGTAGSNPALSAISGSESTRSSDPLECGSGFGRCKGSFSNRVRPETEQP